MKIGNALISTAPNAGGATNTMESATHYEKGGVKSTEAKGLRKAGQKSRTLHLKIDAPKIGGKTRAHGVKTALAIIMGASRYIKLLPKEDDKGEIITNIDEFMTTEEFADKYMFDKKMAGKRTYNKYGEVEIYSTRVRLESDLTLYQMKWETSNDLFNALKSQHIYLSEHKDGPPVYTGNVGWLEGININQASIRRITHDLDRVLHPINVKAMVEPHTVSIRYPEKKAAFVTRVYKVTCDKSFTKAAYALINKALKEGKLSQGWNGVNIIQFGLNTSTTAMYVEKHNKTLHEAAVVEVKNVWSITDPIPEFTKKMSEAIGIDEHPTKAPTIEQLWWDIAEKHGYDIKGMVVRRGTLQILTTRETIDEMVNFVKELVSGTHSDIGSQNFAAAVSSYDVDNRQPYISYKPSIFTGKGKFEIDPEHFSDEDFKTFATKHGIPIKSLDVQKKDFKVDLTKPPRAAFHRPGREPKERDPSKLTDNAVATWKKYTVQRKEQQRTMQQTENVINLTEDDDEGTPSPMPTASPTKTAGVSGNTASVAIKNRMSKLEEQIKKVQDSGKMAAEAAENMHATLEANYQKVQETQDIMNESMSTMERSMTVMMEQIQESNKRVATVFEQTSQQANTMMEMQITLTNINRVLNSVTGYVNSQSDELHIPMDIGAQTSNNLKRSSDGAAIITQKSPNPKSTPNEAGKESQASDGGKNN